MNKREFLEALKVHLRVLEEKEQQDILDEYAQHIDLKMQSGLSEEEAIRDFGDMKELASDILEAYHVNPKFDEGTETEKKEKGHGKVLVIKAPDMEKVSEGSRKAVDTIRNAISEFFDGIKEIFHAAAGGLQENHREYKERKREKKDKSGALAGEGSGMSAEKSETKRLPSIHGAAEDGKSEKRKEYGGHMRRSAGMLWRSVKDICHNMLVVAWNLLLICVTAGVGIGAVLFLFAFGVLLIWTIEGYPFIGITIFTFGGTLAASAAAVLLFGFRKKLRRKKNPENRLPLSEEDEKPENKDPEEEPADRWMEELEENWKETDQEEADTIESETKEVRP